MGAEGTDKTLWQVCVPILLWAALTLAGPITKGLEGSSLLSTTIHKAHLGGAFPSLKNAGDMRYIWCNTCQNLDKLLTPPSKVKPGTWIPWKVKTDQWNYTTAHIIYNSVTSPCKSYHKEAKQLQGATVQSNQLYWYMLNPWCICVLIFRKWVFLHTPSPCKVFVEM